MDLQAGADQLEHIKGSLIANLSIDKDDFEDVPVLSSRGGWNRANAAFGGMLETFLGTLNRALVATAAA